MRVFAARKGQSSVEAIVIAVVILLLFLMVILTVFQKNSLTDLISSVSQNMQQCNKIATIVSNLQLNPGYGEAKIILLKDAIIKRNNIDVGGSSCYYRYTVKFEDSEDSYIDDSIGFTLIPADPTTKRTIEYKIKKTSEGVVFCRTKDSGGNPNVWC